MPSSPRTSLFDLSLEALRRDHLNKYRLWVLVGVLASLLGYAASCVSFTVRHSWEAAVATGDPFVVAADLVAVVVLGRGHVRAAAWIAVVAAFVDAHYSLFVHRMPTLANVGLLVPSFVFTAGLLFGGRVAFALAGVFALSIPATFWAEDALSLISERTHPPDLVLTDVILPNLTGPELVAQLKKRWPSLRCLFVSGYLGDVDLGDGFDPANDLVPKPFTSTELLASGARKIRAGALAETDHV